jgi:hypothetical protein
LLAVPLALLCFSDPALTGRFFAPSESFTTGIGEIYSSSSSYVLNINESQPYNLKSVRISGSFAGDHAKVYLKTSDSTYVVFDSANLPKDGKVTDMLTGALTEVASDSSSSTDAGSDSAQPGPTPSSESNDAQTDSAVDTTAEGGSGAENPLAEVPPAEQPAETPPVENQTQEVSPADLTNETSLVNATNETIINKEVALNDVCEDTCLLPDGLDASSYEIVIEVENGQLLISSLTYSLLNLSAVPIEITIEIVDSNNESIPANITLVDSSGEQVPEEKGLLSTLVSAPAADNAESFEVAPSDQNNLVVDVTTTEVPIKAIEFQNIQATEDVHAVIGVDNVPDNQSSMPGAVQVYAIDPTQLDFTEAIVTVEATGSALYKCASWDFDNQICADGNWAFIQNIIPGQDYNITLTANDPAYTETLQPNGTEGKDAWIISGTQRQNNGASTILSIRSDDTRRSLLEFNLDDVPINSTVYSAMLKLYVTAKGTANPVVNVYRVTTNWTEGTGDGAITNNGVTWDNSSGTSAWSTSGGDFDLFVWASTTATATNTWILLNVTNLVQGWVSGAYPNYGFLLRTTTTSSGTTSFASSDNSNSSLRPILDIFGNDSVYVNVSIENKNSAGTQMDSTFTIVDSNTRAVEKSGNGKKLDAIKLRYTRKNLKVVPALSPVKEVTFNDVNLARDANGWANVTVRLDDVPESAAPVVAGKASIQVYAIDPTALNFTDANMTVTASGSMLYKCANWNFDARNCTDGNWTFVKNIAAGQNYTIVINATDPAFSETQQPNNVTGKDTFISSSISNQNNGANDVLRVKSASGNNSILLQFDLSNISSNAIITRANVTLYRESGTDNGAENISVYRLTRYWDEGTGNAQNSGDGATWDNATNTTTWTTAGSDYAATEIARVSVTTDGYYTWNITSLVQGWVNGTWSNYGMLFANSADGDDTNVFTSDDDNATAQRPQFNASYTIPLNITFVSPTPNNSATLNQSWVYANVSITNSNATEAKLEFNGTNYTMTNASATPSNSWYYNKTNITNGNYSYKVYANDSGTSVFDNSSTRTVTVNADSTPPNITITRPENATYATQSNLSLNYTAADGTNVSACWYSLDSGANTTLANCTNSTFNVSTDGSHNVRVYANDTSNNINSSIRYFSVDTVQPSVSFVSPTLSDGNTTNNNWIYVNVSSSDANRHYALADSDSSLVSWWRLETNGASFTDDSGRSNTGSCTNCPTYSSSGMFGGSYDFNSASSQYIQVTYNEDFNFTDQMTIALWFKYRNSQSAGLVDNRAASSSSYNLYISTTNLIFDLANATTHKATSAYPISTDTWYHAVATYNGSAMNLYINGTLVRTQNQTGDVQDQSFNIQIGRYSTNYLNGSLDDVLIFNRTLSDSGVAALYNATANQYYNNFTNVSAGNHTFKAYAVDAAGNKADTGTRTITYNADSTPPNITIISPENKTYNIQNNIQLNYTATDNVAVDKCWYAFNGGTNTSLPGCSNSTISVGTDGSYPLHIYANDTNGNVGLTVQYFTVDTTSPQYSNLQNSTPAKYSSSTLSLFNVTWTDTLSGINTVLFESNYSGTPQNYSMYLLSGNVYGYNVTLPAGTFYWKSYANDSVGNLNASAQQTFTISKADNAVDLYLNGNKNQNLTVTYLAQTNATGVASSGTANLFRDDISVSNPEIVTLAAKTAGYKYFVNTTGSENYTSNSTTFYLFVNKASPTLSLLLDGVASDKIVSYGTQTNATGAASNAGDSDLTYNLYRNAANAGSGALVSDVQTLAANTYTYIYNTSGGENYTSAAINRTLTVNKAATSAKLFLNGLESNTSQTYGTNSNATATLNVSGLTFQLLRNGTNVASGTDSISELGTLAASYYNYTVSFDGNENYTGNSQTYFLTINKATPALSLLLNGADSDISVSANTNITVNSSSTTPVGATVYLYEDGSYVANGTSPSAIRNYTTLGDRVWKVNISATENYTSAEKTHTISVTDPDAPQYSSLKTSPASPATYYPTNNYQFNATWTDNTGVSDVILEFNGANYSYSAGQLNKSDNEYYKSFYSLAAGTYTYKWYANDTSNNWGKTLNQTYVLDKAITALFLTITPSSSVSYGTLTTVSCSSNNLESSPTLTRNITGVSNPDANVLATGIYNYACTAIATNNYTSASATGTLTVSKAAPVINLTLNGQDSDITLPAGGGEVNATATLVAPSSGDLNLTSAGVLFASGASPLQNSTSFTTAGTYTIAASYGGNDNYTSGSKSHNVVVQSAQQGGGNQGGSNGGSISMPGKPSNATLPLVPVTVPVNGTEEITPSEDIFQTPGILGSAISVPPAKKPNPIYAVPTLLLMILLFAIVAMGQSKLSEKAKKILTALHVSLIIIIVLMLFFTFVKIPALTGGAVQVPILGFDLTMENLLVIIPIAMLGISLIILAWIRLRHTKGKKNHAERNVKTKKRKRKSRKKR